MAGIIKHLFVIYSRTPTFFGNSSLILCCNDQIGLIPTDFLI